MPSSVTDEATLTSVWAGVGAIVGADGAQPPTTCTTPHDVDAHGVPPNRSTSSATHQPRSWSKAEAPPNISYMLVTLRTSQPLMSWLKAEAPPNMTSIFVTLWTAQPPMSWLKAEAPLNMWLISVTPEVSHAPMSWLKAEAPLNMWLISVTPDVSHAPMSSLKDAAALLQSPARFVDDEPQNKYDMSVTPDVSHVEMWPYVASAAAASESHAATAHLIFQLTMTLPSPVTSQSTPPRSRTPSTHTLWPDNAPFELSDVQAPAEVLVEGRGGGEHVVHRCDAGGVPRADVLVKGEAPPNIQRISVTLWTAQLPMSWLKAEARRSCPET